MWGMDMGELDRLSREDPGSNAAVDLLVQISRSHPDADLTVLAGRIVDAWARRLHAGSPYQGRMSPQLREERLNSVRAWIHQGLSEWHPNADGVTGSPSAFLNSRKKRLPRLLPIETGTPADTDEKARRVRAAALAEMAENGEDRTTLQERTEKRLLAQQMRKLTERGHAPDPERARENMRKRGDLKWLARLDELLAGTSGYDEIPDGSEALYGEGLGRHGLLVDLMTGELGEKEQQNLLCAPHLQYLLASSDTTLL